MALVVLDASVYAEVLNQVQSEKCSVQSKNRCGFHLGFGLLEPRAAQS
jgi:hypothetical protein